MNPISLYCFWFICTPVVESLINILFHFYVHTWRKIHSFWNLIIWYNGLSGSREGLLMAAYWSKQQQLMVSPLVCFLFLSLLFLDIQIIEKKLICKLTVQSWASWCLLGWQQQSVYCYIQQVPGRSWLSPLRKWDFHPLPLGKVLSFSNGAS